MDKRISYKLVIDTETCPLDRTLDTVLPSNMFVYDVGWVVTDKRGTVYEARSYVIDEIFNHETAISSSGESVVFNYCEPIFNFSDETIAPIRSIHPIANIELFHNALLSRHHFRITFKSFAHMFIECWEILTILFIKIAWEYFRAVSTTPIVRFAMNTE